MATFYGTDLDESIGPYSVSPSVVRNPPGSLPSNADDFLYGYGGNDYLDGWGGHDYLSGGTGNDIIYGYYGNDYLYGEDGNDTLYGENDHDVLDGGPGNDTMYGGLGNDTYFVDTALDVVSDNANAGTDTINASINYTLGANLENLNLYGTANTGTGNDLDNYLSGSENGVAYTLFGLAGNDTLVGYNAADSLFGGIGNDILQGYAGNDLLDGGTGDDSMSGGLGNDTYEVDSAGDVIFESAGEGTDQVNSSINYTLSANFENMNLSSSAATGTGNELDNSIHGTASGVAYILSGLAGNDTLVGSNAADSLFGGDGNDNLFGYAGNDVLDGGAGINTMSGGSGDDTYEVNSAGDIITESAGEGTDQVNSSVNYALGANVENLSLSGPATGGTGNDLDNYIDTAVSTTAYTLSGLAGNDTLVGNNAADSLFGGDGNDNLFGYAGNDVLDGGAGTDTMSGGSGDDTYEVDSAGDVIFESAGEGTDQVSASFNYTLGANIENLELYGTASTGTGNDLDNYIDTTVSTTAYTLSGLDGHDTLVGNNAADSLFGGDGNDNLFGYGGNDVLDGGTGNDNMFGMAGNDTYLVDNALDVVTESSGVGTDTVIASVSYTLGANLENLYLSGTATSGTGNDLDNYIDTTVSTTAYTLTGLDGHDTLVGYNAADFLYGGNGNDSLFGYGGNDVLDGGTGIDTMAGGIGDDTYVVDNAGDVVFEGVSADLDRVNAYVNYTLGANVENLYLMGTAANGTGNELNNTINGNISANSLSGLDGNDALFGYGGNDLMNGGNGNDILNGGTGIDTMAGEAGDDTYVVDNVGDVVTEAAGAGTDKVNSYINYILSENLENLGLYGTATDGTGNARNNIISGNTNDNSLAGLAGNDLLNGGPGKDSFLFSETGLINRDTIVNFSHVDDTIVLKDILDGASNGVINGLDFSGGVLSAANYFEGAGNIGNGIQDRGIFNDTSTGNIYYNPTSGIAGDAVIICTVGISLSSSLDNTDFVYSA